jgi:predicted HAD superfamily Cof-like phosphohydrolase
MDLFNDIREFHEKFDLKYVGPPRTLPEELAMFRAGFMAEELGEYAFGGDRVDIDILVSIVKEDLKPTNLEDQFDALIDLVYVAIGTAYMQGFDFNEGWRRVHEANMKKVRAATAVDSARGSTYDVVKPDGWQAPSLKDLVSVT